MTEDHPLDYANFEGNIPQGNYGAGTVMVWDRGTFRVEGDLDALTQLAKGEIKFRLNGEKLQGSFVLVKLKKSEKGNEWLMIKHKDAAEDSKWNIDEHDGSALTGRTLEEIKEELPPKRPLFPINPVELQGAHKAAMPSRLEPMLSTIADRPFSDPNWLFEIKWDGVRALAWIDGGALTLRSRNAIDITQRYPELASLSDAFAARQVIVDGEIVALDAQGRSDFQRLQERMHVRAPGELLLSQMPVVTISANPRCSNANSSCSACSTRPNGFATPIISWSTEKSFSSLQKEAASKESSRSEWTACTFPSAAPAG
jgi:bifunctional non-homologous end joining protein LigD